MADVHPLDNSHLGEIEMMLGHHGDDGISPCEGMIREQQHRLAIVPSGGRTGLSGGAVARGGELVLALDRLDRMTGFSAVDRTVCCGAGVLTAGLQEYAAARSGTPAGIQTPTFAAPPLSPLRAPAIRPRGTRTVSPTSWR